VIACPLSCSTIASIPAGRFSPVLTAQRAISNANGSASARYFNSRSASLRPLGVGAKGVVKNSGVDSVGAGVIATSTAAWFAAASSAAW